MILTNRYSSRIIHSYVDIVGFFSHRMQTYSHYIITATLNRVCKQKESTNGQLQIAEQPLPPLKSFPLMLGSIMPDIPLIILSISFILYDRLRGVEIGFEGDSSLSMTMWLFQDAFFNEWWVKSLHNLFHGPLMVLAYIVIGYKMWTRGYGWASSFFWFAIACLIHTAIDIPLHYDDGPLLLFPINMNIRFYSPISYWDRDHYGNIAASVEHILILGLLVFLIYDWWRKRKARQ